METSFQESISSITRGKKYCYVCMQYKGDYAIYERIKSIVKQITGFECIRHDDIPHGGNMPLSLMDEIRQALDQAAFVIIDLSDMNPNVAFEAGYVVAKNKKHLFLAKRNAEIISDLQGLRVVLYNDSREGIETLEKDVKIYLEKNFAKRSLLKAMLIPKNPEPSFIFTSPKPPSVNNQPKYRPPQRKTYGDYIGVVGIITAFGQEFGENVIPNIDSAHWDPEFVFNWDSNLYLIGSSKVNKMTELFLEAIQNKRNPNWYFDEKNNYSLEGILEIGHFDSSKQIKKQANKKNEFGLIVRGPHPKYHNRIVIILAGNRSLGTGAACLAATRTELIHKIDMKLPKNIDLEDHERNIWTLVKVTADEDNPYIEPEDVEVIAAGGLD